MKQLVIIILTVLSFNVGIGQKTKFGLKGGVNIAYETFTSGQLGNVSVSVSENGFYLGGFAQFLVSNKFYIQPELLFAKVKELNQFQIPILAKYNLNKGFALLAGPEIAFLKTSSDGFKNFNYGFDIGASYNVTENFIIDTKYNFGLANLIKNPVGNEKDRLSNFQVGVGYRF